MRSLDVVRAIVALGVSASCAHTPPPTPDVVADVPVARAYELVDGLNGASLDEPALIERIAAARAIFVGEQHDDPHHHFVQTKIFELATQQSGATGLAMEMLPVTYQAVLDAFAAGSMDESAFLKAVDWDQTWGYSYGFFREMLQRCRTLGFPAFALNAPRSLSRAVSQKGIEGLDENERAALPDLVVGPAEHREFVRQAYGSHSTRRFVERRFERFYRAQLLWDETMAESLGRALSGPGHPERVVVLAGEGHTRRAAIPERLRRRGDFPTLLILAVEPDERDDAIAEQAADVLFVFKEPRKPESQSGPAAP
jgi:uncharacterized iron-regulated protein